MTEQAKKNGRARAGAAGHLLLAVGTAAGNVRAFSAATAKEAWAAKGCNEGCAICKRNNASSEELFCSKFFDWHEVVSIHEWIVPNQGPRSHTSTKSLPESACSANLADLESCRSWI